MDLDRNCLKADCHAPFPWFQVSSNSGSGGSQRRTLAGHCALCYAVTERPSLAVAARPFAINPVEYNFQIYGKGSWQSAFPDQLSKGTLRRKKLQADPTRDASLCHAPFLRFQTSCSFDSGGSQRQTQAGHNTPCSALPVSLAVRSLRDPFLCT